MDPPLSEDEESLYSSSLSTSALLLLLLKDDLDINPLSQSSSSASSLQQPHLEESLLENMNKTLESSMVSRRSPFVLSQSSSTVSTSRENGKINDEDIKVKIPLSTSIMLTKLDHSTSDIIKSLSTPRVEKLTIRFQPIGSIEQIQPKIFKISSSQQFQTLVKFLNKKLSRKIQNKNTNKLFGGCVFCYLNNSFTPGPEEVIGNLFEHFAINNELTVSYCDTVAFR